MADTITRAHIKILMRFDSHCQDSDLLTDRKLSHIYEGSKGADYGWEGIAKEDPVKFWQAFNLIY